MYIPYVIQFLKYDGGGGGDTEDIEEDEGYLAYLGHPA
jgi:hypothetical protein